MTSYSLVEEIAYRDGANAMRKTCCLDVYYPTDVEDFATVVWFHGGGLVSGERDVPEELTDQGIAIVTADYRLSPSVRAPAYIEDAAAAVAWTFLHIAEYGGSTDRIFVGGASAGGYLALMVGLDRHWLAAHQVDADAVCGLISVSGQAITHFAVREERGIPGTQPVIDELAPLFHVRGDAPPLLLVTGDRELELFGRYEENAYFQRMLRGLGHHRNELHELKGRDHGAVEAGAHGLVLDFVHHTLSAADPGGEAE